MKQVSSLSYVYCLIRSARRPLLRDAPQAIPAGDSIRIVDVGQRMWAVVSSVPPAEYSEDALRRGLQNLEWVSRRAMAHEAVVEHFLSASAVLPMQLFTLFMSDQRVIEYVQHERRRIERILARVERQLEWGLRLTFDEKAAREAVEREHSGSRTVKVRAAAAQRPGDAARTSKVRGGPGSSYLARKRDLLNVTRVQLAHARTEANRLYRALAREATEARRRSETEQAAPGSRLLLDAAFLVPARQSAAFRSALRKHARMVDGTGVVVSLTGPWPPYNFIDPVSAARGGSRATAARSAR